MRKSFEYSTEMDEFITSLYNDGETVNNILTSFNNKFGSALSKPTFEKHIKQLGLSRYSTSSNPAINYDKDEIIRLYIEGNSVNSISEQTHVSYKRVQSVLDSEHIDYKYIQAFKSKLFFKQLDNTTNMVNLEDEYIELMANYLNSLLNPSGLHVETHYSYSFNGKNFIFDFYCPECQFGCVYNGTDGAICNKNISISDQVKIEHLLSSKKSSYVQLSDGGDTVEHFSKYEGMNLYLYLIDYNFLNAEWEFEKKADIIAHRMIDKFNGRVMSTAKITEYKELESIIRHKELEEALDALVEAQRERDNATL